MRALVTGAAGFIGRHVVSTLIGAGAEVVAFDRAFASGDTLATLGAELVLGDVLDREAIRRSLDGCDAVFHLAARYSYVRADAALMHRVNVEGTRAVLAEAAASGPCRRLIHTSSCATCGPVPGRAADERDLPPAGELAIPYKRTKLEGERLALSVAGAGLEVVVVNPTVPVGSGDERPTPTGKMVADVASGRARGYLARSALNVVAVEDVAAGHLQAFEHGRSGERYLLGGENMTIREVFATVTAAAGLPVPRIPVPWAIAYSAARIADLSSRRLRGREPELLVLDEVRAGRLPHLFDDAKARRELGYVSRPAAEALALATRWALSGGQQRAARGVHEAAA